MNFTEILIAVQIGVTILYATYLFWDRVRDKPRLEVENFSLTYHCDKTGKATSIELRYKVINRGQRIARWCETYIDVVDAKTKRSAESMRGWWLHEIPDAVSFSRGNTYTYYRQLRANEWDRACYMFNISDKPIEGVPKEFGVQYIWPYSHEGIFDVVVIAISGAVKGYGHIQIRISKKLETSAADELTELISLQWPSWQDRYAMRVRRMVRRLLRKEPIYSDYFR